MAEQPFPGREAVSDEAGVVQITSTRSFLELFSLVWNEATGDEDERTLLDQYLAFVAESDESFDPGDTGQGMEDNRPMPYRYFELSSGDSRAQAISGVWTCDESGRIYGATYLSAAPHTADELLADFEELLTGVSCPK